MKRITLILLFFCILFLSLFCSCTNKYSKPYSAEYVARELSKKYGIEIEIIKVEEDKFNAERKHNTYTLKDKKREIIFKAGSYVTMDRHIPVFKKVLWDDYPLDLMRHYRVEALQLVYKYGVYLKPPLPEDSISYAKNYSPVWPTDSVFINSPEQLDCVVDLYTELAHLYNFTYIEPNYSLENPDFTLYYSLTNNDDNTRCVKICNLLYLNYQSQIDKSQPGSSLKKEKYIYSFFEKYEVRNKLYQSWNKLVDEGTLAEKKVRYKMYPHFTMSVPFLVLVMVYNR